MLTAWELFVLRHRRPLNLYIHFISFIVYYGSPLAALAWGPWWLLGLPLSGAIGAFGHYISGDGGVKLQEATFSPQVVFFVTVIFYKIFRGHYLAEVMRAEDKARRLGLSIDDESITTLGFWPLHKKSL